jgi:hypothetical protein
MATAVGVARDAAPEAPVILWPADWPAPELVAWTLAHMLAETLPGQAERVEPIKDQVQMAGMTRGEPAATSP